MFFFECEKEPGSLDCPSSGSDAVRFTTRMSHFVLDGRMTCGELRFAKKKIKKQPECRVVCFSVSLLFLRRQEVF